MIVPSQPIKIFQGRSWVLLKILLSKLPPNSRSFKVKCLVDVAMWRKEVVHDNEVDFPAIRNFHPVQAIELRYQGIGVGLNMRIVLSKNFPQKLVLSVMDCLDDVLIVPREVEEASTFAR